MNIFKIIPLILVLLVTNICCSFEASVEDPYQQAKQLKKKGLILYDQAHYDSSEKAFNDALNIYQKCFDKSCDRLFPSGAGFGGSPISQSAFTPAPRKSTISPIEVAANNSAEFGKSGNIILPHIEIILIENKN